MILNRLGEPDRCPSCKVTLENRNYDITHRRGENDSCSPRPLCQRINQHLVLPLLLLPVVLLLLGIVRLIARPEQETLVFKGSAEALKVKDSLEEFEDRDLINGIKTSFVPLLTNTLPLNVLPLSHPRRKRRRRRHIREVFGSHDAENASTIDTIVWAAVKPPFKHDGKVADENERQNEEPNEGYDDQYEQEAFQDDEQEIDETEIEPQETSVPDQRNNWELFWIGKNDEESIRSAQAQMMLALMNISVDPCEDFYEYACGRWAITHMIPKNRAGSDTFEILRSSIDSVVRRLLEDDLEKTEGTSAGSEDRSKLSDIISAREGTSHEEMGPILPMKPFIKMTPTAKHLEMKRNNEKALPPDITMDKNHIQRTLQKNEVAPDPLLILSDLYQKGTSSEEAKGFVNGDFSEDEVEDFKAILFNKTSPEGEEKWSTNAEKYSVKARVKKSTSITLDISNPKTLDTPLHSHESQLSNEPVIASSVLDKMKPGVDALLPTVSSEDVIDSVGKEFGKVTEEENPPTNNSDLVHSYQRSGSKEDGFNERDMFTMSSKNNDKNSVERVIPKGNSTEGMIDEGRGMRLENSPDRVIVTLNKDGDRARVKLVSQAYSVIDVVSNKTDDSDLEMKMKGNLRDARSEKREDHADDISSTAKSKRLRPNDAIKKARSLYQSCMNTDIIQKRNEMPLVKLLEELGGGWPKQSKPQTPFEWTSLAAKLRLFNNNILIAEWVGPDIRNSSEYVIQLDEAGLGLPTRDYFLSTSNTDAVKAYKKFVSTIAQLLGASSEEAEKLVDQIVDFEIHLALITATHEEKRNLSELYHKMTVDELSATIPGINWRQYLGTIMESTHPNFDMSSLNSTVVVVFAMRYFRDLASLLDKYPPSTIHSYMLWRFASHRAVNLDRRFLAALSQLRKTLTGREEEPPRWETCVAHTTAALGHAVGSLFVKRYFDEQSKSDTLRMTTEIRTAFRESILDPDGATATWMDRGTRSLAVDKADAMALRVGYPDSILDPELLDLRYADLKIDPGLYFENTLAVLKYLTWREHSFLGMPVDKMQWSASPTEVNGFYSRNKNQILLPAGILQPPFYHRHFPRSLNYGGVGVVIGHEMTHGFDIRGRLFDRNGNLRRWWQPSEVEAFQERAKCLIDQYSQYFVDEVSMQIDGVRTLGENIADNGGIKQAYKAYEDWLRRHGEGKSEGTQESLPGLDASPRQLFFLNFAQVWCGALRPEAIRNKLKTSIHSLGKFRVIGALSNSNDFASAFSCPVGSPMNPQVKCSVW